MKIRTLYLCYFGLREPLVQTQVLPYLRQLCQGGIEPTLLTFEPDGKHAWSSKEAGGWRARLGAGGVRWLSLPYHKRPSLPATSYDIAAGACLASHLVRRHAIDVVHGRSHVGAAIGAIAKKLTGVRLIFDIRGFLPEEYVEGGVWPAGGLNFRLAKRAEQQLLAAADGFVVLTERARDTLFPGCADVDRLGRPVEVIPCCVDMERLRAAAVVSREEVRGELGAAGRRVLVYIGALGGLYLTEAMAEFVAVARRQDPTTLTVVLTQSPPERIVDPLRRRGIKPSEYLVRRVPPEKIPRYLRAADLALSFKQPGYSSLACSPTKLPEYLACGLPVISNTGVGDVDGIIEGDRVGVIIRELGEEGYLQALSAAEALRRDPGAAERCRACARDRFDLDKVGGERYRRLYRRLLVREASDLATASLAK
jgi:glycosyltransferase involved in cell wall biosynthesis